MLDLFRHSVSQTAVFKTEALINYSNFINFCNLESKGRDIFMVETTLNALSANIYILY